MNEGMENLKELEKLELIIKKFKQLVTEKESEVAALKQQLHTERESLKKEADELMMKKIEHYEKELALVREDAQIQILTLEKLVNARNSRIVDLIKINKEHQKLNGELREDNKKLARQIDDYINKLRKAGLV